MAVYELRSPVVISEEEMYYGEFEDTYGISELSTSKFLALKDSIFDSSPELVEYISKDSSLYGVVTSIYIEVDMNNAVAVVKSIRDLTSEELKDLENEVTVQYSDGWGEGFEQNSFYSFSDEIDVYDDEDDCYNKETGLFETFAHFWNRDHFYMNIKKVG